MATGNILPLPPIGVDTNSETYRRYFQSLDTEVSSGLAPVDAQYWLSTANVDLTNERNIGALSTGFVKITTVAGVATPSSTATVPVADISGTLPIANGGTNSNTALSGQSIVVSDGTRIVQGAAGTASTLLHGNAAGAPTYGAVALASEVSGTLPVANGGTNSGTALSGSSIMVSNGTGVVQGSAGTTTTVLHGNASGTPTYGAVSLTADVSGDLPFANLAQGAGTSVLGVTGGSTADVASIAASADGQILTRAAGALVWSLAPIIRVAGSLTTAQIRALNSAPVSLVAAQGSGQMIVPLEITFKSVRSGTTFSVNGAVLLRWSGIATDLINSTTFAWNPNTAGTVYRQRYCIDATPADGSEPRNVALVLTAAADMTGGDGTTLDYDVTYKVVNFS